MKKPSFGTYLFLSLVLLFLYVPIVIVVLYSFNNNPARIPLEFTGFTTQWYENLFTGKSGYGSALWLSFQVAVGSVLLSIVVGSLGAIGMAQRTIQYRKSPSKADKLMDSLISLPIMIPEIILGFALMVLFNLIGISDNLLRLILAHTTFCIPYIYLSVKSRLAGIEQSLFDAARDLGASPLAVMRDITIPLCMPAIISGAALAFAMSMDDFVISFFVYGVGQGTLPIMIYSSVKVGVSLQVNALCTIIIVVIFTSFALSQFISLRKRPQTMQTSTLANSNV